MELGRKTTADGKRQDIIIATVLVIIIIGASVFTGVRILGQSEFCAACHQMRARVVTWQTGIHGKKHVDCLDCHADAGWLNRSLAHIEGVKYLVDYFKTPPLSSRVPNSRCLSCHFPKEKRLADKIAILHFNNFLKKEAACSDCHRALAHTDRDAARLEKGKDPCGRCHPVELVAWRQSTKKRRADCEDCHLTDSTHSLAPRRANAPRVALTADVCLKCHSTNRMNTLWENSTHKAPQDVSSVQKQATELGVTGKTTAVTCAVCHDPHTTKTRGGSAGLCLSCHKRDDMFSVNRPTVVTWPEPSFQKQHLDHEVSCADCHIVVGNKMDRGVTQHGFQVTAGKCAVCHPGLDLTGVLDY